MPGQDPDPKAPVVLDIEGLAVGGSGVGRADGRVWFVPGTVPGDRVRARALRARRRFTLGRADELLVPSSDRRVPPCPYQTRCGGCPWMPLPEGTQRDWKRRVVLDSVERLGGLSDPPLESTLEVSAPLRYRNRIEVALALDASGAPVLGLHAAGPPHEVLDVESCRLAHEDADRVLKVARSVLLDPARRVADSLAPGSPRRMVIRRSSATGEVLVGLWETPQAFPAAQELAATLLGENVAQGVVRLRGRGRQRGGLRSVRLAGKRVLEEEIAGTRYRLPVTSFVQVSTAGAEMLVRLVREAAGDVTGARVLDLYGGVGIHALALCRAGAAAATVCDADRDAVACGRDALRSLGEPVAVRFVHSDVRRFLEGHQGRVDVVVANPPRRGLGPRVVDRIVDLAPRRVVLVSCDPATLARDLRLFVAADYRLTRLVPVDLFPQTAHVEAVAALER